MKITKNLLFLMLGWVFFLFGENDERHLLKDACAYVSLSANDLNKIYDEKGAHKACIGCDESQCESKTLMANKTILPEEWERDLANITLETEEFSVSEALIAERP